MKRTVCVFFTVWLLTACFLCPISAQTDSITEEFGDELRQFMESIPEGMRSEWSDVLSSPDGMQYIGEKMSISCFFDHILSSLRSIWPSFSALLLRFLALLICAAVFGAMKNAMGASALAPAFDFCCTLCTALILADSVGSILQSSTQYMSALTSLSNGIAPVCCAVCAASGKISTAAVGNASLMLLYTLFQNVSTVMLTPVVKISMCLSITGCIAQGVRMEALNRCVRRFFTWTLALLTLLITFVVGIQSAIAQSTDSFSLRTVKFALGSFIPLVGGALSDALGTATGSLALMKNTCGVLCAAVVVLLLFPQLIRLILQRAVLSVCQGAAEMIGCEREGRLIAEMNAVLGYILAVTSLVSFLFLFVLGLMIGIRIGGN